jgi:hypothetical protein
VGDFNGDGVPDLAAANVSPVTIADNKSIGVLLNSIAQTATATLLNAQVVGAGTHSLEANYSGSNVYAASNGTTGVQAAPLATTLALSAPGNATTGESVQVVASLSPYSDSSLTTNGETVTFKDGGTVLGTASLNNGIATLSVAFSSAGSDVLQVSYGGDTNFAPANSNSATVSVTQAATFIITPTPNVETVNRDTIGAFVLTLNPVNGFNGNVKLSCSGGPSGSYCVNFPMAVHVSGTAYAISGIFFPKTTTPGTYTITFAGVSGTLTNTATAKFTVK